MQNHKIGVLLVNLGTPDSPKVPDVRKYLREFLMDGRVIDIPTIARFMLVNLIIAPFRSPKSAKIYKQLWTQRGSPLLFHGQDLTQLLQKKLGENYVVSLGMRYQNPSLEKALEVFKNKGFDKIVVLPLFPQYASATTGSVHQKVFEIVGKWQNIPKMSFIDAYPDDELMIATFAEIGKEYLEKHHYDHLIFTYHGLPQRQLRKAETSPKACLQATCCQTFGTHNRLCYKAQCYETSRNLAKKLGISAEDYTVCFQSRLGSDPWIQPYTEDIIKDLAKKGKKNVLAFTPSFVADCLETTIEVGEEYKEVFEKEGGHHWQLVPSLNTHPLWVDCLEKMVKEA